MFDPDFRLPTSKGALAQALFDAVGTTHMEGFGNLLVHEALTVQDVGHHHTQVEDLQKLGDGGHLHQIPTCLIQVTCIKVLQHCLKKQKEGITDNLTLSLKFYRYIVWECY